MNDRRRSMLVDKSIQSRMLRKLCAAPLIGLAVTGLLVIASVLYLMFEVMEANIELSSLAFVVWSVALFVGATAGFLVLASFRFSYRVAGPAYHIVKALEEFQERGGEFQVRLRAGDELQDLATKLNEVMGELRGERDLVDPGAATAEAMGGDAMGSSTRPEMSSSSSSWESASR